MQIGQGESLVHFFVSGFANSPKSGRSSGEERVRRFISIVFCRTGQKALLFVTLLFLCYTAPRVKQTPGGKHHGHPTCSLHPCPARHRRVICLLPALLFRAQTDRGGSLPPAGHGAVCPASGSDDADGPDRAGAPV